MLRASTPPRAPARLPPALPWRRRRAGPRRGSAALAGGRAGARELLDAQSELILGSPRGRGAAVERARAAYRPLDAPDRARRPRGRPAAAVPRSPTRAARRMAADQARLAAARGAVRAALFRGSYAAALDGRRTRRRAAARGAWLLVREFRTATRFTRPGADATLAVGAARGRHAHAGRGAAGRREGPARRLPGPPARAARRRRPRRRARPAQPPGRGRRPGRRLLRDPRRPLPRGSRAGRRRAAPQPPSQSSQRAALREDRAAFADARSRAPAGRSDGLHRRAAHRARSGAARPAAAAVPRAGAGRVRPRRQRHARSPRTSRSRRPSPSTAAPRAALADLADQLAKRNPARIEAAEDDLARLGALLDAATKRPDRVAPAGAGRAARRPRGGATQSGDARRLAEGDRRVRLRPDRARRSTAMEAAAGAGEYRQAEQARLEAYAFFEFGPERRLKAFDPGLALDVEGLIWFGAERHAGPGQPDRGSRAAPRDPARRASCSTASSPTPPRRWATAPTAPPWSPTRRSSCSAKASEAVLILAAHHRVLRRRPPAPAPPGAGRRRARPASPASSPGCSRRRCWARSQRYGEKLEAVVGLIAIGVLLLITNWFFHRVYWSEWIGKFHRRRKRLESLDGARLGFLSAQVLGLAVLGLTSVYREGFETVLFLQSLQLSAGHRHGARGRRPRPRHDARRRRRHLRAAAQAALQEDARRHRRPDRLRARRDGRPDRPHDAGHRLARRSRPVDDEFPYWSGLWFGVYPTWETLGAQLAAAVFVIGSYLARASRSASSARSVARARASALALPLIRRRTRRTCPSGARPRSRRTAATSPSSL